MSTLRRLERILNYDYRQVQEDAIETLGDIADPMATDILLAAFTTKDFATSLRQAIIRALGQRRDLKALDLLKEVIETEGEANISLALDAVIAIGRIGGEQAMSFLQRLFHEENVLYRAAILTVLEEQDDPLGAELALLCVDDHSPASWVAFRILCRDDTKETLEFLKGKLNHSNQGIRLLALKWFVRVSPARAFPFVVAGLRDSNWENRHCALERLGEIADYGDVVAPIQNLLEREEDLQTISQAIKILESNRAVTPMVQLLKRGSKAAPQIFASLVKIGDPRGISAIQYYLDHYRAYTEEGERALEELYSCLDKDGR